MVPSYGMDVEVERIHLKVQPVECEALNEAQDCFSEEGVDTEWCLILI